MTSMKSWTLHRRQQQEIKEHLIDMKTDDLKMARKAWKNSYRGASETERSFA